MPVTVYQKQGIEPDNNQWYFLVNGDPSSLGLSAAIGSVAWNLGVTTLDMYNKTGSGDSNWVKASPSVPSLIVAPGFLTESGTTGIIANPGGGQASAVLLTAEVNIVGTVATAGDSVKLPVTSTLAATQSLDIIVVNAGANPVQVFGSATDTIDGVATATGVSQMPNSVVLYIGVAGLWRSEGLATGYFGQLQTLLGSNAITAFATGGQGAAVVLTSMVNRVSVCATAGDSVKLTPTTGLPIGAALQQVVINDGAASCNVFPSTGDTINTLAANSAFAVPAGQTVTFTSTVAGAWQSSPAQTPLQTKFTLDASAGPLVAVAGELTGANYVTAQYSGVNASTLTTRTATLMIADGGYKVGQCYNLRIANSAAGTATLTAGVGVTLTGKVAIATNTAVDYVVTITGAATMTFQSVGTVTIP